MSYDVHIRVAHHPKYDEDENVVQTGFKMADPPGNPLFVVASCLRQYAAELEETARREDHAKQLHDQRVAAREQWEDRQRGRTS
jgi:hypothetical protein